MLQNLIWCYSYRRMSRSGEYIIDKKTNKPKIFTETYYNYIREGSYKDFRNNHRDDFDCLRDVKCSRIRLYDEKGHVRG